MSNSGQGSLKTIQERPSYVGPYTQRENGRNSFSCAETLLPFLLYTSKSLNHSTHACLLHAQVCYNALLTGQWSVTPTLHWTVFPVMTPHSAPSVSVCARPRYSLCPRAHRQEKEKHRALQHTRTQAFRAALSVMPESGNSLGAH